MYDKELVLDMRYLELDEKLWEVYCKKLRKKYRKIHSSETGMLSFYYSNDKLDAFRIQAFVKGFLSEFLDKHQRIEFDGAETKKEKALPIYRKPECKTYLMYSTRLAILQNNPQFEEWILHWFINMKAYINPEYKNFFFLQEELEQALLIRRYTYAEVAHRGNVIDFVRNHIEAGLYVDIHLDEYYIQQKEGYHKQHYVHENMIYGYSDFEQIFYVYGHTMNQKITTFTVTYEQFLYAYEKGKLFTFCGAEYLNREYPWPVFTCCPGEANRKRFTVDSWRKQVTQYLYPPQEEKVEGDIHIYGVHVYDCIKNCLLGRKNDIAVDFRTFQLLYEHKECMKRRMEVLSQRYPMENKWQEAVEDYLAVVKQFQAIRLLYLREMFREGLSPMSNQGIQNEELQNRVARMMDKACEDERQILEKMMKMCDCSFLS